MRLLVDEDSEAHALVQRLRDRGHDVLTVGEAGLRGAPDPEVLLLAAEQGRALLTRNAVDFAALHAAGDRHAGILAIHAERDVKKRMSYEDIAVAIENVERAGLPTEGELFVLNAWRRSSR